MSDGNSHAANEPHNGRCANGADCGHATIIDKAELEKLRDDLHWAREDFKTAVTEIVRLKKLLNTPEILDFAKAVQLEAAHQRERWGSEGDAGKTDADWFWLIGYLAGKALHNPGPHRGGIHYHTHEDPTTGEPLFFTAEMCDRPKCPERADATPAEKQLHRIITIAAAAANWHAARLGKSDMRPGIATPAGET